MVRGQWTGWSRDAPRRVHDVGQHDGIPYSVSELLHATTVRAELARGPLSLPRALDCAIQMDGDGQHPPTELAKLLEAFAKAPHPDLIIGSRYIGEGAFRSTFMRRVGSGWLRLVLRVLGVKVTDPTSGYRLYGARALALFDRNYSYDYPEPESLALAGAMQLRIAEVPVVMRERQGGSSSIAGLKAPYYMLKVTLAVLLSFIRVRLNRKEIGRV